MRLLLNFAPAWALALFATLTLRAQAPAPGAVTNDYAAVSALLAAHCLDCHAAQAPEGKLVLESFATLMKGGESGPVIVPGKSAESLLYKSIEGTYEREGKRRIMPPGKRKKLEPAELAVVRSWIDAGALAPKEPLNPLAREVITPKIKPLTPPPRSIYALDFAAGPGLLAVARGSEVELRSAESRAVLRTLTGHRGRVQALAFSREGKLLAAGGGEAGLAGEVRLWNTADGQLLRTLQAHPDAVYAVALSPDGATLATGSYDQKVKLWNVASGELLHTLSAHNGAIFALAFRPDGKVLASASADRTVKLWSAATGKRLETLSQSTRELFALAFSPDGRRLVTGGADNRLRLYEISESAAETTNPLLESRFAHEGAILKVAFSADGKTLLSTADDSTVKLWRARDISEKLALEKQPEVTPAVAFLAGDKSIATGRLDGSLEVFDSTSGKRVLPPAPELTRLQPRGFQRGTSMTATFSGKNLAGLTNVTASTPKLTGEILSATNAAQAQVKLTAGADLARGPYEVTLHGSGGTAKLTVQVDDLPAHYETAGTNSPAALATHLPASFWGVLDQAGDQDEFDFQAQAGETLVLELAVKALGSKLANGALTLLDAHGAVLAADAGFDGGDRFLEFRVPRADRYRARVSDQMLGASADHAYRLSVGALAFVTGVYPLSVGTNRETEIELIGANLPSPASVRVKSSGVGELDVPLDAARFRAGHAFKLLVSDTAAILETGPNSTPAQAQSLPVPGAVNARLWNPAGDSAPEEDCFRFEAQTGRPLILETVAARRGAPVDTRLEILFPDGRPVPRLVLQAVRNSAVTFRGIDSVTTDCRVENWEEMDLDQLLYLEGEVVRIFRMPQGPDSGFLFYTGAGGKRRSYFDTSGMAHALDAPCFVVEPHPPGARLPANGLPAFTLHYGNDDDGERELGSDSRLQFTAPTNGAYVARVTDTRGHGGASHAYRLEVREAKPDFKVTLTGANPTVPRGSGQSFSVNVKRIDGFEGEVRIEIAGLPEGFSASTPLVIQAGHTEAKGTLFASAEAPAPDDKTGAATKLAASAVIDGRTVTREVNSFGRIKLGDKPKLLVTLEPIAEAAAKASNAPPAMSAGLPVITLAPGQTIPAQLKIHRQGYEELVTFFVENLPHGVIVADIGLSGVLIPKGESARQIFLQAARWVPETERVCYAIENQAGKQTSRPVLLRVKSPARLGAK